VKALAAALDGSLPAAPSGGRTPAPGQVAGPDGQPATDAQVEKAEFSVLATANGQTGWVVLEMSPTDVVLTRG
jgi:hypothetical protein